MALRSDDFSVFPDYSASLEYSGEASELGFPDPSRGVVEAADHGFSVLMWRLRDVLERALPVILVAVVLSVTVWAATRPPSLEAGSRPGAPAAVVVADGQTLYGLAQRYAPLGVDWRAYADELVALNDLRGPLREGERLLLPR